MRYLRRIIAHRIDELVREAGCPEPDSRGFARRGNQLLGLITAHFEEEEEVLLPILDSHDDRRGVRPRGTLGSGNY
jgi:hypothetical protein